MCAFVKENFKDATEFSMMGAFSAEEVGLSLAYPGTISMMDGAALLSDVALKLSVKGIDSAIFIKATLKLKDPPLEFKGKLLDDY